MAKERASAKKKPESIAGELLEPALVPVEEQPYLVPENWVWTRLGNISEYIQRGKSPKYSDVNKFPVVSQKCVQWSGFDPNVVKFIAPESIDSYGNERFLKRGDILWNSTGTGTIGRLNIYNDELSHFQRAVVDSHVTIVRTNEGINNRYVYYYLCSPRIQDTLEDRASGTTNQIELSTSTVIKLTIPLPPYSEQQSIVDRIESLFAKLDQAKRLAQSALDSFETRRAAILHKAFTGEITAKWREVNGISLESWEEKTLNQICKISSGGTPSRQNVEYYNGHIPWIKTGEIAWNNIYDSEEKITIEAIKNSSAKLFKRSTVLVAMYGQGLTRGRAAILEVEAATNQAVCALNPIDGYDNKFLYYFFMNNYWCFREKAIGGNQPNYSLTMIGNFSILCPTLLEQKEIVGILDKLLKKEQSAKEIADVIDKIDYMKNAILTLAFRGELSKIERTEESALDLLKSMNNYSLV